MANDLTVGFIGLGIMGAPMAELILRGGFALHVYNRTASRVAPLARLGAQVHTTPRAVAEHAQVIVVMVNDAPDVAAVVAGPDGILDGAQRGTLVVNMSTVAPQSDRDLAAKAQAHGVMYLDAPVSGGDVGAKAGTLSMMVGGAPEALERAMPILRCLGSRITHCGTIGAGQATKLCNQMMVAANVAGLCEAWHFARQQGLDLDTTFEAVSGGAAASWQLTHLGPRITRGDFDPGFRVRALQKDLRAVAKSAAQSGATLHLIPVVQALLALAARHGDGEMGTHALAKVFGAEAEESAS